MTYRPVCAEPGCPVELERPERGRPPIRCPEHRRTRRHRKVDDEPAERRPRRRRLAVVPPAPPVVEQPQAAAEPPVRESFVDGDDPPAPPTLAAIVRADLATADQAHPLSASLAAGAERLAELFDSPVSRHDPRTAAAVWRELRATLADLARSEAPRDEDDDLFGDLSAAVVISA